MSARPHAFVLLAYGYGASSWRSRYLAGKIIGLNEEYAYGYHHAQREGFDVYYSEDQLEHLLSKLWRFGVRALLGFDFVHAWRNREAFFAADVVWTHTENMSLAASLMCQVYRRKRRPKLILQSVWLCDQWDSLSLLRRRFYKTLLSRADILTFLSPLNAAKAREIFPGKRCEFVRFGIPSTHTSSPRAPRNERPLQLLSIGNDRHRDWPTLVEAVRHLDDVQLVIVSGTAPKRLIKHLPYCRITSPKDNSELKALFEAADIIVVPLKQNLHASGITVVEEAVVKGCPLVVTDVGGLRGYFDEKDVWYVKPGDPHALRQVLLEVANNREKALAKSTSAQKKLSLNGLSSAAYASEHVRMSCELLGPTVLRAQQRRLHDSV